MGFPPYEQSFAKRFFREVFVAKCLSNRHICKKGTSVKSTETSSNKNGSKKKKKGGGGGGGPPPTKKNGGGGEGGTGRRRRRS